MATISRASSAPLHVQLHKSSIPLNPSARNWIHRTPSVCVLKTAASEGGRVSGSQQHSYAPSLLKKPVVIPHPGDRKEEEEEEEGGWVDWEDKILEETVPLVSFVRSILHSGK